MVLHADKFIFSTSTLNYGSVLDSFALSRIFFVLQTFIKYYHSHRWSYLEDEFKNSLIERESTYDEGMRVNSIDKLPLSGFRPYLIGSSIYIKKIKIPPNLKSMKGQGTFLLQIGLIRNHRQFDVKLSTIEGVSVSSHFSNFQLDWPNFT